MVWATGQDASCFGHDDPVGDLGADQGHTGEIISLLGMSWYPLGRVGGSGLGEEHLNLPAWAVTAMIHNQRKGGK